MSSFTPQRGNSFRKIVHKVCEDTAIAATRLREREREQSAKEVLGKKANQMKQRMSGFGKRLGHRTKNWRRWRRN
jgi:hypothetical protein